MKALMLVVGLAGVVAGLWLLFSEAHTAVPIYAGEEPKAGDLYALPVVSSDPCIIEIDEAETKPQLLNDIREELRNLSLLRGSPNVEQENYLLADIPPYTGAVEISLNFYGQRILEIHTRGRGESDIINRRYSINSRAELIEVRELRVQPKATDETETSIKPIEFIYEISHDTFAFSYGCILQHRHGQRDAREAATKATPLSERELSNVAVDQSLESQFQNDFIELLSHIKQERTKTVEDALFDSAALPTLPESSPEPTVDQ